MLLGKVLLESGNVSCNGCGYYAETVDIAVMVVLDVMITRDLVEQIFSFHSSEFIIEAVTDVVL